MDNSFFRSLPKVEIHNHLEGTITPTTLHELAKKNRSESIYAQSLIECQKVFEFIDFPGFLNSFAKVNSFVKNTSDLDIILHNVLSNLKYENYRYAEFFISLDTFVKKDMGLVELLDRLQMLRKKYSSKDFVIGGFIIDFVRNYGPENANQLLDEITPILDSYRDTIIGISIGGDELNFPALSFGDLFHRARKLRLKTTAHAGEATGPESIWDTILNLKTDRIGHGLHIHESMDLIKHFRATQTPIEICPTSNVKTGLIDTLAKHPIQYYQTNGLNISINTDDAGFFNSSLSNELESCAKLFNFEMDDIKQFILNAAHSCFYDPFLKRELIEDLKYQFERSSSNEPM